ncbi:MAG: DNA/RNA non-specific endonuclease [Bryobacteraceae bacterium]|nr:DNA/RNA non-specific endonuclease [Bryobacteraceae bacterium]
MNLAVEAVARKRVERARDQITKSLLSVAQGNPLGAERDLGRLRDRVQKKAALSRAEAGMVVRAVEGFAPRKGGREAIWGDTLDFVGVQFLERGWQAARAVARVALRNGRPLGSGFMVSESLFLTNHHVISSARDAAQVSIEFEYELDWLGNQRGATRYALDPGSFYLHDDEAGLDYCLVGMGPRLSGAKGLSDFGCCKLSDAGDKHALGEVANIVQHPDGRYKEVVLRENRLVSRLELVLHYVADTEPGSSGSPVFNNEWEVIALHHWGGPWRQKKDERGFPVPREVNEGIRISAIVQDLLRKAPSLTAGQRELLGQALAKQERTAAGLAVGGGAPSTAAQMQPDGSVRWTVPLEVAVRLPWAQAPPAAPKGGGGAVATREPGSEKVEPDMDFSGRGGYKPGFLTGHTVPLPRLTAQQRAKAAVNRRAEPGDDELELKYHHFSIVMNAERRLAYFTACNIDGKTAKHVNRDTGVVEPLRPDNPGLREALEAAEGTEKWYDDDRIGEEEYAGTDVYEAQRVPGFPDPRSTGRRLRMFQKGHLVRRMDPAWGSDSMALRADADTFFYTNAAPQVGFFNQGKASGMTGVSNGHLWRAVENYVLRNAAAEKERVCSFTGPVFRTQDRKFRGIKVPAEFWKVTVWSEGGELRSLALLANQKKVFTAWPEKLDEAPEAFLDDEELGKVEDFLTTVEEIERLTKLDFGAEVRQADVFAGQERVRVRREEDIPLRRKSRKPAGKR